MKIWKRVERCGRQSKKTYHMLIKVPKQKERKDRAEAIFEKLITEFSKTD